MNNAKESHDLILMKNKPLKYVLLKTL